MEPLGIHAATTELVRRLWPEAEVLSLEPFGPDSGGGATGKAGGYGRPLRIRLREGGEERTLVLRTASANPEFGHDRRADRAEAMVLDYDTFGRIPNHVRALDVGAVGADGRLLSLGGAGEFFVLTTYAPGTLYVDDLREIARAGRITGRDEARCTALSRYLVALHAQRPEGGAAAYHRAIRDLLGHGEGIFGMVDSYPEDSPGVTPQRLQRLERKCLEWRWRLRPRVERLRRTHGDFHPFNILFDGDHLTLVDASRGCQGDPADDVTALAINYVFFGLESPGAWKGGLGALWRRFWRTYLEGSGDTGVLEVLAPYLAWRGLVVCNPRFYPGMKAESRDALLGWVERALDAPRFDPRSAEGLCP